jgi:C4-dicarboxylate transporter DctM subunit
VTLIVFGVLTEQSIGKLFLAGIIPGLIIAIFYIFTIYIRCKRNPAIGPKGDVTSWKLRFAALPEVIWVLVIFLLVIGGLMWGFFTPTEGGSIGTFAVLLLSIIKKDINFKGYIKSVVESLRTACMVLMLIAGSAVFGHFLARTKIPMLTADWAVSLPVSPYLIIIIISVVYLIGGSFIDDLAFLILATPIFFPVAIKLGYDPLWFSMLIAITVMIGGVIPPVAMSVFIVKAITKQPFMVIYNGVYPFLISLVAAVGLLFLFPGLATFLPYALMK